MVISGVVKSLIINFSPSLIWLPGAVRSVCVSSFSSAGNMHYTCCVTELIFVKRWRWVNSKLNSAAHKHCAAHFAFRLAPRIAVPGAEQWQAVGAGGTANADQQHPHTGRRKTPTGTACEVISRAALHFWPLEWWNKSVLWVDLLNKSNICTFLVFLLTIRSWYL